MKCQRCRNEMEGGWSFCPKCGSQTRRRAFFDIGSIFNRMKKEMDDMMKGMDNDFEKNMEMIDLSKPIKGRHSGFTIKIIPGEGGEPKVEVKSFGNVDQNAIHRQVQSQIGNHQHVISKPAAPKKHKHRPTPKVTEEPATEVRKSGNGFIVEILLPGVKKGDIDINDMESSVEVKAYTGEKAYFKIITKPPESSLVETNFDNGKLVLQFA